MNPEQENAVRKKFEGSGVFPFMDDLAMLGIWNLVFGLNSVSLITSDGIITASIKSAGVFVNDKQVGASGTAPELIRQALASQG